MAKLTHALCSVCHETGMLAVDRQAAVAAKRNRLIGPHKYVLHI